MFEYDVIRNTYYEIHNKQRRFKVIKNRRRFLPPAICLRSDIAGFNPLLNSFGKSREFMQLLLMACDVCFDMLTENGTDRFVLDKCDPLQVQQVGRFKRKACAGFHFHSLLFTPRSRP